MPLTIVPTPIGNLSDITLRAIDTLKVADLVLCENTRASRVLLKAHGIDATLLSYHAFNERARLRQLLEKLQRGEHLALISTAGTPGICDPGQRLVAASLEIGIEVRALPGPCALITALVNSGFEATPFQFVGFLNRNPKRQFEIMLAYGGVSICYESPRRIVNSLRVLQKCELFERTVPRPLSLAKELTKKFERQFRGTAEEILAELQMSTPPKGEWALVLGPSRGRLPPPPLQREEVWARWQGDLRRGLPTGQISRELAHHFGVKRQEIYRLVSLAALVSPPPKSAHRRSD